jgi:hypothetical protein
MCYHGPMSEWAQRDLAQSELQKQNRVAEEAEALDPGRQAAAGQSAELAEEVAPEAASEAASKQGERPAREKAQAGRFDLLAEGEETEEVEAAAGTASGGQGQSTQQAPSEKESGIEPLARLPEVEGVAARASRGGAAAELLGSPKPGEPGAGAPGAGAPRVRSKPWWPSMQAAFEPGRPLAFTARKRRRINDLQDPELDALLAAVREVYPTSPEVAPDPALAAWAEAGGVAFDEVGPRGVLDR